jgi:hypothetical protein
MMQQARSDFLAKILQRRFVVPEVQRSVASLAVPLIEANGNAALATEPVDPAQELVPGHQTGHVGYFCPIGKDYTGTSVATTAGAGEPGTLTEGGMA